MHVYIHVPMQEKEPVPSINQCWGSGDWKRAGAQNAAAIFPFWVSEAGAHAVAQDGLELVGD